MKKRPHPQTTRLRIEKLEERTSTTIIPNIERLFNQDLLDEELCKEMIEKMTFSNYPGIRLDGTIALSALLLNSNNATGLKSTGSLGAVVELLRKSDIEGKPTSTKDLVHCLHVLTIKGDKSTQMRLMSHPYGISTVLRLCQYTTGRLQEKANDLLLCLTKLDNGIRQLVNGNIIQTLMTAEMLYRGSTTIEVRHSSANLVHRITVAMPEAFPVDKFVEHALDSDGRRRIDSYQEIQFLHGLMQYWNWLSAQGKTPEKVFTLFGHLINEIKSELFDNLDHCMLLVKCCVQGSRQKRQSDYMLDQDLTVALQYLVRTDFSLYRKKHDGGGVLDPASIAEMKKKTKRLSIQDSGDRPIATLLALSMVKPVKAESHNKEDMNYFAVRSVVTMYENILEQRVEIISDIVSSGLIPGLLFRVGPGNDKDARYLRMVVHFLHSILMRVSLAQSNKTTKINLVTVLPRRSTFHSLGTDEEGDRPGSGTSFSAALRARASATDLRSITNTLHAQGVTELLLITLATPEEASTIAQALMALSIMVYPIIKPEICKIENLRRIFSLGSSRSEYLFPAMSLICDTIAHTNAEDQLMLNMLAIELKGLKTLVHAMKLSGWFFPMKGQVYRCLVKLCHAPNFREKLVEYHGLGVIVHEVRCRRDRTRASRKAREAADDGTDIIYQVLREDVAGSRIQSVIRARLAKTRVARLQAALAEEESFSKGSKSNRKS